MSTRRNEISGKERNAETSTSIMPTSQLGEDLIDANSPAGKHWIIIQVTQGGSNPQLAPIRCCILDHLFGGLFL